MQVSSRALISLVGGTLGGLTCADNRIGKGCAKFVVLDRLIDRQAAGFGAASRWSASPTGPKRFSGRSTALQRTLPRAAQRSLLWLAPSVPSTQQRFLRRGGDPGRTQLRDSADELYRSWFGEWELDRPLSQLISAELILIFRASRRTSAMRQMCRWRSLPVPTAPLPRVPLRNFGELNLDAPLSRLRRREGRAMAPGGLCVSRQLAVA